MDSTSTLAVFLLLCGSAFFSSAETAFSTVNKLRLKSIAEDEDDKNNKKATKAVKMLDDFDKLICTILIGNNIVNIGMTALTTFIATELFGSQGVGIASGVTTLLVLTFGEIIPKSLAKTYNEKLCLIFAQFLYFLVVVIGPVSSIFIALRLIFTKTSDSTVAPTMTEQDLVYMINTIEQEGVLEKQEKNLVQSALKFDETNVQEILTPRVNVVALNVTDTRENILETITEEGYSRVPVYENSVDNIIGIVHSRELLIKMVNGEEIDLNKLKVTPKYIHRTKKLSSLLNELQREKIHFCVVIDDHGGTLGIVTMEDVLEELVGEIWDESDDIVQMVKEETDGSYTVAGDMDIEDFFEHVEYSSKKFESSYSTMNGWALERLEHIPEINETFSYDIFNVTIKEMDDQRITLLSVVMQPPATNDDQ